jgi:prepilin-type N-terminal cleavage/methylation domain-containing protein
MPRRNLSAATGAPARRRGFTLAELLVAMVLLTIVMTSVITLLLRQQRFYASANEVIDSRSQLRQAASILPADLRGLSTPGSDFIAISPTSVTVLANFGSAVICNHTANTFVIPPLNAVRNMYTTWSRTPVVGDSVFILDEGPSEGAQDDVWLRYAISVAPVDAAGSCPVSATSFTDAADPGPPMRVTIDLPGGLLNILSPPAGLGASVKVGSVVRFVRPVQYSLYQAADTRWYLGIRDYVGGAWTTVQPVSGPYETPAGGATGMSFAYFNEAGAPVTTMAGAPTISRIDMVVRTLGTDKRNSFGKNGALFRDSLAVRVAIRNRQ